MIVSEFTELRKSGLFTYDKMICVYLRFSLHIHLDAVPSEKCSSINK